MTLLLLVLAFAAHADAIDGDDTPCPAGAVRSISHAGSYCVPDTCPAPPNTCTIGSCRPVGLCLHPQHVSTGRLANDPGYDISVVTKSCSTNFDCDVGDVCDSQPKCARASWLCSTGGLSVPAGVLALTAAGLLARTRSRALASPA